jgi:hypothetical protein
MSDELKTANVPTAMLPRPCKYCENALMHWVELLNAWKCLCGHMEYEKSSDQTCHCFKCFGQNNCKCGHPKSEHDLVNRICTHQPMVAIPCPCKGFEPYKSPLEKL